MLSVAQKPPTDDGLQARLTAARARRHEPIRRGAIVQLEAFRAKREQQTIAVGESPKRKPKRSKAKGSRRVALLEAEARTEVDKQVTKEAQRNGDYQFLPFKLIEVTESGRRIEKVEKKVRNLASTVVERWNAKGYFDDRQMAAILFYQEAFRKVFGEGARVTANYSPAIVRGGQGSTEVWLSSIRAAKVSLLLLDEQVFKKLPRHCHAVWQNVVIWDEAAGVAGGRAGYVNREAEGVAKETVKLVAHMIADVVIDARGQAK